MSDGTNKTLKSKIIKYSVIFFIIALLSVGGWYLGNKYYDVDIENTPKKEPIKDNDISNKEEPKEEKNKNIEEKENPDVNDIEVMNLITKLFPNYMYDSSKQVSNLGFELQDKKEFLMANMSDQTKLAIALETMEQSNINETLCSEITEDTNTISFNNENLSISCGMSPNGTENTLSTRTIKSDKFIEAFKKVFGNEEIINIIDFKYQCNYIYHYNKAMESFVAYNALNCENDNTITSLYTVNIKKYTNKDNGYKITIEFINNSLNDAKEYMLTYKLDTTTSWYLYSTQKIK